MGRSLQVKQDGSEDKEDGGRFLASISDQGSERYKAWRTRSFKNPVNHGYLRQLSFFKGREPLFVELLKDFLKIEVFLPGATIIKEGEISNLMYIIYKGSVEVVQTLDDGSERWLAKIGEGSIFGEMALFGDKRRNATVRALEVCDCRIVAHEEFWMLIQRFPRERAHFERLAEERKAESKARRIEEGKEQEDERGKSRKGAKNQQGEVLHRLEAQISEKKSTKDNAFGPTRSGPSSPAFGSVPSGPSSPDAPVSLSQLKPNQANRVKRTQSQQKSKRNNSSDAEAMQEDADLDENIPLPHSPCAAAALPDPELASTENDMTPLQSSSVDAHQVGQQSRAEGGKVLVKQPQKKERAHRVAAAPDRSPSPVRVNSAVAAAKLYTQPGEITLLRPLQEDRPKAKKTPLDDVDAVTESMEAQASAIAIGILSKPFKESAVDEFSDQSKDFGADQSQLPEDHRNETSHGQPGSKESASLLRPEKLMPLHSGENEVQGNISDDKVQQKQKPIGSNRGRERNGRKGRKPKERDILFSTPDLAPPSAETRAVDSSDARHCLATGAKGLAYQDRRCSSDGDAVDIHTRDKNCHAKSHEDDGRELLETSGLHAPLDAEVGRPPERKGHPSRSNSSASPSPRVSSKSDRGRSLSPRNVQRIAHRHGKKGRKLRSQSPSSFAPISPRIVAPPLPLPRVALLKPAPHKVGAPPRTSGKPSTSNKRLGKSKLEPILRGLREEKPDEDPAVRTRPVLA